MKLRRTSEIDRLLAIYGVGIDDNVGKEWIDHRSAITLGKAGKCPLSRLLKGTEIYFDPKPKPPPPTREYIDLMARLRKEEEERQYRYLTGLPDLRDKTSIKDITKEVNEQLTTIFNVIVSIVAVAWAFWYWCSSWPLGIRTLMSLFAGIVIAIAEVVVLNGYHRRLKEARDKTETATPKPTTNTHSDTDAENEKIKPLTKDQEPTKPQLRHRLIHDDKVN